MKAEILFITALMFASLFAITALTVEAQPNYEQTKYDPREDVMRVRAGGDFLFADYDNVEITKMTSHKEGTGVTATIELTMTVVGQITEHDDYKYVFVVETNTDTWIFGAWIQGEAIGFKYMEDQIYPGGVSDEIIDGGHTLKLTFNALGLGDINSFDFTGGAVYSKGDYERYLDMAPDKLILITEPSHESTVGGTITVKGVVRDSADGNPSGDVKIKIDAGTWEDVSGSDPWTYPLDTTSLSPGEHTIYVEVEGSGLDNADDDIKIIVDQNTGNYRSFSKTDNRAPNLGDKYHYETIGIPVISGIPLDISNTLDTEIQAIETITLDGTDYETYRVWSYSYGKQDLGRIDYENEVNRTSWKEKDTFGTVKEHTDSRVDITYRTETTVKTDTEYDPPFETHSDFSVTVGFNNKWPTYTTADAKSTTKVGNDPETTNPPYTESYEVIGECLYYKSSHTVFGESFDDIYIIRTYYKNPGHEDPGVSIVEYYSPEYGVPVQIETYDPSRNLMFRLGLESYKQIDFSIMIDDITFDPVKPKAETKAKVIVSIKNVGTTEASNFDITVMDGDRQVADEPGPSILADETKDVPIDWTPKTEGTHTIKVIISYQNDDLMELTTTVDVESKPSDGFGGMPMVLLLIIIIVIVVIVLLVVLMKRKKEAPAEGEAEAVEAEAEGEPQAEVAAPAVAPVTVAAEPEPTIAPAAQAAPQMITETIVCPSCKQNFSVQYDSKPVRVKCPGCGTEGVLN